MKYTFYIILAILLLSTTLVSAQTFEEYKRQVMNEYHQYKSEREKEFNEYRDRVNAEYAAMMQQAWGEYNAYAALKMPTRPEPPTPRVKVPSQKPQAVTMPNNVKPQSQSPKIPEVEPQPIPKVDAIPKDKPKIDSIPKSEPKVSEPISQPSSMPKVEPSSHEESKVEPKPTAKPKQEKPSFKFNYYGMACSVRMDNSFRYSIGSVDNQAIAKAWQQLSNKKSYDLVDELLGLRSLMSLCDWGYVMLIEKLTRAYYGEQTNEAILMQIFLLVQSGYKARIGFSDNKVLLMLAFNDPTISIYNYTYVQNDGTTYYLIDKSLKQGSLRVFDKEFPNESFCSLEIEEQPALPLTQGPKRNLKSKKFKQISFDISTNINLAAFYNEYPHTSNWGIYVNAPFGATTESVLYNKLKTAIAGKSRTEAANMLLDFVQTAFLYKTDQDQFGYERPLFGEELFYYPYCDCEDRAIFYARLVKDLLDLDVILLNYPSHLATAVCFNQNIEGTLIEYKGKKYYVCDPTYINSSIGDEMPDIGDPTIFEL